MKLVTYDAIDAISNAKRIGIPTDYSDTLLNFVKEYRHKVKEKDLQDINWIACKFLDKKTLYYYTWWCVNEIKHLMKDKRSVKAVDTLKLYIDGKVTIKELEVAADNANVVYGASSNINNHQNYHTVHAAYRVIIAPVQDDGFSAAVAAKAVCDAAEAVGYEDDDNDAKEKQSNLQIDKLIEILESK
jgi:hypothetical protein